MPTNEAASSSGVTEGILNLSSVVVAAAAAAKKNSKKPKYSKFTQQDPPACNPILTPTWVITTFICISVIFISIGLLSLFASEWWKLWAAMMNIVFLVIITTISLNIFKVLRLTRHVPGV